MKPELRPEQVNREWDIVIVTYNSADALLAMWADNREIKKLANIIVVDNSSIDESEVIASQFADIVSRSPNHGLSKSNNLGAALGSARYLLFCNPDVRIASDALSGLKRSLETQGGLSHPGL